MFKKVEDEQIDEEDIQGIQNKMGKLLKKNERKIRRKIKRKKKIEVTKDKDFLQVFKNGNNGKEQTELFSEVFLPKIQ